MRNNKFKLLTGLVLLIVLLVSTTSCFNICQHEYEEIDYMESTCSKEGYVVNKCKLCEKEVKKTVKKTPHNNIEEIVNPTCTEEGYTLKTCKDCGYIQKENVVSALSHSFGSWEIIQDATSVSDGLKTRTCQRCGHVEEETITSMSYVDLEIINEPFDPNINYTCNSYEELLLKFNSSKAC